MNQEKAIETVMKNFDFKRVHKSMEEVGWSYFGDKGTPSIARLKETARKLLQDVADDPKTIETSTGGFSAERDNEGEFKLLRLRFYVEESQVYFE